jgi:hypothetical protein
MTNAATVARRKAVTAHYIAQWGPPTAIIERKPLAAVPLAVMEFSSRTGLGLRYATNGMSEHACASPSGEVRTELYAAASAASPWIVDLLDALARYPVTQSTWFGEHDTVPIGRPIDRRASPFSAVMLGPPEPEDEPEWGAIPDLFARPVIVLRVIGIFDSEADFAEKHGGEALYRRLVAKGAAGRIDVTRPRVA